MAGQRPEANSFNVDGVLNDDHYSTGPQVYISNEAISQFNLVQNQFSAEFGGGSGGIFNVITKSGTNQIHGSLYEYLQNRDLNAVDANNTHQGIYSLPRFDFNRLGATIGGPIKKDKTYFYFSYEITRRHERLIRDRSLRERMGRHARARVEQHFTLAHQAGAWIACLQRLFA